MTIAWLSMKEAMRRKLVLAGLIASVAFVGLFALGFWLLYREQAALGEDRTEILVAATVIAVLGLYAVQFLAAFLAMFVAVGAISTEVDSGQLHAVLARPLTRTSWLLQRGVAFSVLAAGYVLVMTLSLLLVARVIAGYEPIDPLRAVGLMMLQVVVLIALGLAASARWSTLAAGVAVFGLFGLGWLGGIIELVGDIVSNDTLRSIGIASSLLIPSDALWRGASYYLSSPVVVAARQASEDWIPFASVNPPSVWMIVWSCGYAALLLLVAVRRLGRRDL
jgi:ABC-type transport system involved in multi-copper enzyme maturation permease subunit